MTPAMHLLFATSFARLKQQGSTGNIWKCPQSREQMKYAWNDHAAAWHFRETLLGELMKEIITVIKLDHYGNEQLRYSGTLRERFEHGIVIQAPWTLAIRDLGYVCFEPGDVFIEYYYRDRWFNIFAIYNRDGIHKGWYCNIAEPARISEQRIEQIDLLLDVWVSPTGELLLLDEDEFAASNLPEWQQKGAQQGLQDLLQLVEKREEAFAALTNSPPVDKNLHESNG